MISISRVKFGIFISGLVVVIPMAALLLMLLSALVASFQQGADPASIFKGNTLLIPEREEAYWRITTADGRYLDQGEQEEILSAYWAAWEAFARAHETGLLEDLPTYWSGTAIQQVIDGVDPDRPLIISHKNHELVLTFFSDDGSVVAFHDENFTLQHNLNGQTLTFTATAHVVMTIDNGFWRIRLFELSYN